MAGRRPVARLPRSAQKCPSGYLPRRGMAYVLRRGGLSPRPASIALSYCASRATAKPLPELIDWAPHWRFFPRGRKLGAKQNLGPAHPAAPIRARPPIAQREAYARNHQANAMRSDTPTPLRYAALRTPDFTAVGLPIITAPNHNRPGIQALSERSGAPPST